MTDCISQLELFPTCKSRKVIFDFQGGDITSDAGVMLLRLADRRLGLSKELARRIPDTRSKAHCDHSLGDLLRQRIYAIALGYEDLNDHNTLRHDIALQTAVGRDEAMGSASTLCRLENRANRETARIISEWIVEQFIASYDEAPEELILDFDATDDRVHGSQEGRFFHGYYYDYCFLPLYVFCNDQLLVSYLRPSNIDAAKHSLAILSLLVKRLRTAWPEVRIIFRGDSGFCRRKLMSWCERHQVGYVIGIGKNNRLSLLHKDQIQQAEKAYEQTGEKQRLFSSFYYAAGTWNRSRRIVAKAEHTQKGSNPRYVVTNLDIDAQGLYDQLYCARGDMENRIKEQQLGLFADRTSCAAWWANQWRVLLSSLAYVLLEYIRRKGLSATQWAKAQVNTIRLTLLKLGAAVIRNTRRVYFHACSAYAHQSLFETVACRLNSS